MPTTVRNRSRLGMGKTSDGKSAQNNGETRTQRRASKRPRRPPQRWLIARTCVLAKASASGCARREKPQYAERKETMPHGTTDDFAARREAAVMAAPGRRPIGLVGMIGAGKTSIGRRGQRHLGLAESRVRRAAETD